jgi:tetratricopeptide (TPR) repeat protein
MSGEVLAVERALAFPDLDLRPGGPAEAWLHAGLARTLQDLGDLPGAQVEYGIALPVLDAVPSNAAARLHSMQLGLMHNSYGLLRYTLGDPAGAKVEHEQALDLLVPGLGEDHGLVAATRNNLGLALKALGDLPAARIEYERATSVLDTTLGKAGATLADVDVGRVHANLGTLLRELGHRENARAELEHAIAIMEAVVGPDDARLGAPHCTLATVLSELGEHDAACHEAARAVAISEAAHGIDHPEARLFRANLATLQRERGVP